jgi:hypothetical protein
MSNETLEALLVQQISSMHQGPCYPQQFSDERLCKAKSATRNALAHVHVAEVLVGQ